MLRVLFKGISLFLLIQFTIIDFAVSAPDYGDPIPKPDPLGELLEDYFEIGTNYNIQLQIFEEGQRLTFNGFLNHDFAENLRPLRTVINKIKQGKDIEIDLNSGGGYQQYFREIEEKVTSRCQGDCHITTIVSALADCSSACVGVYMVGETRIATSLSNFGFHSAHIFGVISWYDNYAYKALKNHPDTSQWANQNLSLFQNIEMTDISASELEESGIFTNYSP